jgi:hypothetical protein
MDLTLRHVGPNDVGFLSAMLAEAMAWRPGTPRPPASTVLMSRYVIGGLRSGTPGSSRWEASPLNRSEQRGTD